LEKLALAATLYEACRPCRKGASTKVHGHAHGQA
jgi:hypothetical protein